MLSYTVYSESGGTEKTTTAANLAVAHRRQGLRPLVIDMDHQTGNISHLFDVAGSQSDPESDHLPRHMIERNRGPFSELVETTDERVDVIPAHDKLEDLNDDLTKYKEMGVSMGDLDEDWQRYEALYDTLRRNDVHKHYDVLIIDPNAKAEITLQNGLYATRNLVAPVEFGGKGSLSIEGLEDIGQSFAQRAGIDIGVLAIVPHRVQDTKAQRKHKADVEATDYDIPVKIGERQSLMEMMWDAQASAFTIVEEEWDFNENDEPEPGLRRVPDRERETLEKFRTLADHIAATSDLDFEPLSDDEGEREVVA